MEEKAIKMIMYYVLGVYDNDKKTIESCIEVNKLLIAMVKNEETKADKLINSFPAQHPVTEIYRELRDTNNLLEVLENSKEKFEKSGIDNDILKNIEDDANVKKLCNQIAKLEDQMKEEIFIYDQKYDTYIATINNIEFSISHLPRESEFNYIKILSENYEKNLNEIANYMLSDDSFMTFFNCLNITPNELVNLLDIPNIKIINESQASITYCNHKLDKIHIISFEFIGIFEKFAYLSIDG